jgi:hypothetical protein
VEEGLLNTGPNDILDE